MRGIIEYYDADPEFINSVEGWVVKSIDRRFESYFVCEESDRVVRDKHRKGSVSYTHLTLPTKRIV